ncbi:hypothetical protein ABT370_39595, partial [Streptomyces rubradiris]
SGVSRIPGTCLPFPYLIDIDRPTAREGDVWTNAAGALASAMSSANSAVTLVLILRAATPL